MDHHLARAIGVAFVAASIALVSSAHATQRALLIGVGDYEGAYSDLDGPPHDVAVLRDALVDGLGFPPEHVVTLLDGDATRRGIVDGLDALVRDAAPGDFVFVYLSGHGTSAQDDKAGGLALGTDTGAFVPSDYPIDGTIEQKRTSLLIGSRDVRPRLEAIDRRGVSGMVVVDSCFSENSVRSAYLGDGGESLTFRFLDSGLDHLGEFPTQPRDSRVPYPYRRIVTIAASSKHEKALDWGRRDRHLTHDGRPHGAFTDSLLRTLRSLGDADADRDGAVSNRELFGAVSSRMRAAHLPHSPKFQPAPGEDPGLGDSPAFRQPRLASAPPPSARPLRVHVVGALPLVRAVVEDDPSLTAAGQQDHELRVERAGDAVRILTRYGDQVTLAGTERAATDALVQQPWIRSLVASANTEQRFKVDVSVEEGETYVEGDELDLAVSSNRQAHLLVVALAPDGTFRVLHPTRSFGPAEADKAVRFGARVNAPFGIDHVVAVAYLEPPPLYDAGLLESAAIEPGSLLHQRLRTALGANDPEQARSVLRVVTVPRSAVGG